MPKNAQLMQKGEQIANANWGILGLKVEPLEP